MTKTTKILLAISLSAFALGFTDILWGLGRPVGAIFFGLFMIFKLLEKEMALYDEEERLRLSQASKHIQSAADERRGPSMVSAAANSRQGRVSAHSL
jgi:hypothetical protein